MLFITNREMEKKKDRIPEYCFLDGVSHRPSSFKIEEQSPSNNLIYGAIRDNKTYEMTSIYWMLELKECKAKHILFYIHGFDTLPKEALKNASKLQTLFDAQKEETVKVVAIIWPGDDSTLEYWHAQKSADASAFSFHRALSKLSVWAMSQPKDDPCRKQLHVLAHSMGNRVLRESLIAYKKYDCPQGLPALFQNIFLMAPDLVNETLEKGKSGHVIIEASKNIVITYAYSDIALKGSKLANLRGRRLGHSGVEDWSKIPDQVLQKDCDGFNFKEDPRHGHTYFFHPECMQIMFTWIMNPSTSLFRKGNQ